jgi:hypothetical protein
LKVLASIRLSIGVALTAVLTSVLFSACIEVEAAPPNTDAGSEAASGCLDVTQECRKDCSSPGFVANGCSECPAGSISASQCPVAPTAPVDEPGNVNPGLYVATCITVLSNKSPQKVLRFYTTVGATKLGSGSISLTPMRGWESTPPPGVSKPPASASSAETVGQAIQATNVTIGTVTFSATLGKVDLPGEANGISGRPISLDTNLEGLVSQGVLRCAGLRGQVTNPVTVELDPTVNVCLFKQVSEGDAIPTYTLADFVCQ